MLSITSKTVFAGVKKGIRNLREKTFGEDLMLSDGMNCWMVPAGTPVKVIVCQDFGYVVLPPECKDTKGREIPRRFFRY